MRASLLPWQVREFQLPDGVTPHVKVGLSHEWVVPRWDDALKEPPKADEVALQGPR